MGSPALPAACDVQSRPVQGEWGHVAGVWAEWSIARSGHAALVRCRGSEGGATDFEGASLAEHAFSHGRSGVEPPWMLGSGLSETIGPWFAPPLRESALDRVRPRSAPTRSITALQSLWLRSTIRSRCARQKATRFWRLQVWRAWPSTIQSMREPSWSDGTAQTGSKRKAGTGVFGQAKPQLSFWTAHHSGRSVTARQPPLVRDRIEPNHAHLRRRYSRPRF